MPDGSFAWRCAAYATASSFSATQSRWPALWPTISTATHGPVERVVPPMVRGTGVTSIVGSSIVRDVVSGDVWAIAIPAPPISNATAPNTGVQPAICWLRRCDEAPTERSEEHTAELQ